MLVKKNRCCGRRKRPDREVKLALILAGALIPGPIPAYEVQGNSIIFTDAEIRVCIQEGLPPSSASDRRNTANCPKRVPVRSMNFISTPPSTQ